MAYLAIDLGTSFIKGAVLELDPPRLSFVLRVPFPRPLPSLPTGHWEYSPSEVVGAARDLLETLSGLCPEPAGIVMCGQMHGLVLAKPTGQALSNCITWRDQRALEAHLLGGGSYYDELRRRIGERMWMETGNELRPGFPLTTLFWMAENGVLPEGPAVPASLLDFVAASLCGTSPVTEPTNAAAHGALRLQSMLWHEELIRHLGLTRLAWPAIQPFHRPIGQIGLAGRPVPFYTPVGDQQCALAGAFLREGELSLNISTGSQVAMLSHSYQAGDYQTRPYLDGDYLRTITHIPAGRSLDLLMGLLREIPAAEGHSLSDPWGYAAEEASRVGETDLRVDLSFYASIKGNRGAVENIGEENLTVGHLFRAAFQGMRDNYWEQAHRLDPGGSWNRLVFSGGVAQKAALLRDIICERFNKPGRVSVSSEDTLAGLLAMALVCDGRAGTIRDATTMLEHSGVDM